MFGYIKNHKILFYIVSIIISYLLICNICANTYYHLTSNEKVEKVVAITPSHQRIVITSEELIEKVNRQFHTQVLFSFELGALKKNTGEEFSVTFYDGNNKEMKDFSYDFEDKRVYPGKLQLPKSTILVIEELVSQPKETA